MDFNPLYISPYLSIQRAEMTKKIVKCQSVLTEILNDTMKKKTEKKTNFIVCLNDKEVK